MYARRRGRAPARRARRHRATWPRRPWPTVILRRIDGLLVVAREWSSHSSPIASRASSSSSMPHPRLSPGSAGAGRHLAAALGAGSASPRGDYRRPRRRGQRTAGWSRANPASGCSRPVQARHRGCADGGGTVTAGEGRSEQERLNAAARTVRIPVTAVRRGDRRPHDPGAVARPACSARSERIGRGARWVLVDKAAPRRSRGQRP